MPRRRQNDPMGVSDRPNLVTDPVRQREITEEFTRRVRHILQNYRGVSAAMPDPRAYNKSLAALKLSLEQPSSRRRLKRLHPELEVAVALLASDHAKRREVNAAIKPEDIEFAKREAVARLSSRPGAPGRSVLRYHVEAMMALLQEVTGRPVMATLKDKDDYDPRAVDPRAKVLIDMFMTEDPALQPVTIVNIIRNARRKYAGKPMRFIDFFPQFAMVRDPETPEARPAMQLVGFAPPIYFR